MSLLLQALSWNYVLVTALISSILSQMIKVLLNLIIVGKFIPERMWGAGGMPSAHSATVCAMVVATGRYCGTHSTLFAIALIVSIIVMYDAMGVRRETGEQAKVLNHLLNEWIDQESEILPFLGHKRLKEMVGHTPIQVLTGAVFGAGIGFAIPIVVRFGQARPAPESHAFHAYAFSVRLFRMKRGANKHGLPVVGSNQTAGGCQTPSAAGFARLMR